jgi:HlyD family secretion protein
MTSPTHSNTTLFRKEALEKQSGPRTQEERMQLIAPRWWIAVVAVAFVCCLSVYWGWYGRIYTKVNGSGMMVRSGEFRDMVSLSDGIIQSLNITEGVPVSEGEILVVMSLPLEQIELDHYQSRFKSMKEDVAGLHRLTETHVKQRTALTSRIAADSGKIMKDLERLLKQLTDLYEKYQSFRGRGLVTESETVAVLQNMLNTEVSLIRQHQETANNEMGKLDHEHVFEREFWQKDREIRESQQDLALRMAQYIQRKHIVCHSDGNIINIHKSIGDHVASGEAVCTLQHPDGDGLFVDAMISAAQIKTVREGQTVHISPSDTEPYRIGYMLGTVEKVGLYPANTARLSNWYKNEDLIRLFKGNDAAGTVRVRLISDPANPAGVQWTGKIPENVDISAGRLCTIKVTVEQRAPISYVLPYIRKTLMGYTEPELNRSKEAG